MWPCSYREDMYRLCICHLIIWWQDHYSSPSPWFGLKMQNICLHLWQSQVEYTITFIDEQIRKCNPIDILSLELDCVNLHMIIVICSYNEWTYNPFLYVIANSFFKFGSFLNLHCFTDIFYYWECSLCRTFSINREVYWFYVLFNMSN